MGLGTDLGGGNVDISLGLKVFLRSVCFLSFFFIFSYSICFLTIVKKTLIFSSDFEESTC